MKVLPAILLGILLALSAEGVQYFLPYRAFNVNDMISNLIGMGVGGVSCGLAVLRSCGLRPPKSIELDLRP